jgi:2,4-diketo-3-deoxy-L-fuconate hydrolase
MRLIRFGAPGSERPGLLLPDDTRVDASAFGEDWDERFLGSDGLSRLEAWSGQHGPRAPRVSPSERLGPVIFFKSTTALSGPDDDVVLPRGSAKTDWEVELAVVVGRRARYVRLEEALSFVAGYALHNDYSEREHQLERKGQWVKGKSADTFAPFGPFLATPDEVGDVQRLDMWLTVNGKTRQKSRTSNMIFGAAHLVHYVSQFMTLLPGDVISTGTPSGVGLGLKPPVYLTAGDVVECGIEKLGRQRQRIVPST